MGSNNAIYFSSINKMGNNLDSTQLENESNE
jgi:hypothetical protein